MDVFCAQCGEHSALLTDTQLACGHVVSEIEINFSQDADAAVAASITRRRELKSMGFTDTQINDIMLREDLEETDIVLRQLS